MTVAQYVLRRHETRHVRFHRYLDVVSDALSELLAGSLYGVKDLSSFRVFLLQAPLGQVDRNAIIILAGVH